jgi:hypothetical protein
VERNKEQKECQPDVLRENIERQKEGVQEKVIERNNLESVQDLLDIRQEVMQLRSANNAFEF